MTMAEYVGKVCKHAREEQGLTLYQVSKKSGLQIGHIRKIEEGRYNMRIDVAARLAQALGIILKIG